MKHVWFDMDGTLYNLYKIPNWLDRLQHNDMTVFSEEGYERKSINKIRCEIRRLQALGVECGVITWLPKGVKQESTEGIEAYSRKFRWIQKNIPELAGNFHASEYGVPKGYIARIFSKKHDELYIIDDDIAVRKSFTRMGGIAINANRGFIKRLNEIEGGK